MMGKKPEPTCEAAVAWVNKETRTAGLHASSDAAEDFSSFGEIVYLVTLYTLHVDARYDFDAVLKYIEDYG